MNRLELPIVFVLVFLFPAAAHADSGSADDQSVWVSPPDCAALVAHRPDADVAYQPGVDARGRPVAPADLPGHEPLEIDADQVSIDLRIPLSAFFDVPVPLQPIIGNAEIDPGRVTVRDGVAYLGGQRLADREQNALARACAERL